MASPVTITHTSHIALNSLAREEFSTNYNKASFELRHHLHESDLFQMPALMELAEQRFRVPNAVYFNVGELGVSRGWDFGKDHALTASEALRQIETAKAWMILRRVQEVPAYHKLLHEFLAEAHAASGREYLNCTHSQNLSIILTSPNRITPYHFDADCNYLLQIHGSKTVHVFDGSDRAVVTPHELEQFYRGDINAGKYKPQSEAKAAIYELTPGVGVHVPVTFPHWVQNQANVSVSVSINFCFNDERMPNLHRVNHYLRRAGLKPRQPGESAVADSAKLVLAAVLRRVKRKPAASGSN